MSTRVGWCGVMILGVVAPACTSFRNGNSAQYARSIEDKAHKSGDATLASYATELGDRSDNYAVVVTADCLNAFLDGSDRRD